MVRYESSPSIGSTTRTVRLHDLPMTRYISSCNASLSIGLAN